MAKLINLTPHPVTLLDADGKVVMEVPPSGQVLRLPEKVERVGVISGVEVYRKTLDPSAELPPEEPGTYYIVSLPVAQMAGRSDFLVPNDLVRDEEGRVVGCRSFAVLW